MCQSLTSGEPFIPLRIVFKVVVKQLCQNLRLARSAGEKGLGPRGMYAACTNNRTENNRTRGTPWETKDTGLSVSLRI